MSEREMLKFKYDIRSENGLKKEFAINLDAVTLRVINEDKTELPEWTKLEFNKCPNCSLDPAKNEYCPVAVNLSPVMAFFKDSLSYESSEIILDTNDRTYSKKTSLQQGVSSMIGIIMVTSGCPVLSRLRPMVRFHLPFANPQETLYRTVSMYLMQQYFHYKKGLEADWDLKGLIEIYKNVHEVNIAFFERLSTLQGKDANVNALIILDNFANYVNFNLDNERIIKLETLFGEIE